MAQRKKGLTKKQSSFLAAYAKSGNISDAARAAKVRRVSHYTWLKESAYISAFEEADQKAADALESEARRRAVGGILKPVYYQGVRVGTIREYSDTLLIFLMKGAMPEKYRERQQFDHSSSDGSMAIGNLFDRVAAFKRQSLVESEHEGNGHSGNGKA